MTEGIIIDGIKYFKQRDINKGLNEEHYVTEFHLLATHYNLLLEDYARKYNSLKEQLKHKEQECENLKAIVTEAEEAPICFHCSEEPCIRQERDKYKKLSVHFKNVNKYLGHKYITLKKALDEIEINISEYQGLTLGKSRTMRENDCIYNILDIINKVKR